MKPALAKKTPIRISVVESDPLRFVGFRALFDADSDFELSAATQMDMATDKEIDVVLLGSRSAQNLSW